MDDAAGVLNNPYVDNFSQALESKSIKNIVNSKLKSTFGENPIPFHAVSIMLHFLDTVLVFLIFKLIFDRKTTFIAALLFLVHPANSEAVSWISGSVYLYQALFWLLSMYFYVLFRKKDSKLALAASYLFIFGYVFTITSAWIAVFPLTMTVLDIFVFSKKFEPKKLLTLIPFYLALVYYLVFNFSNAIEYRTTDLENYYVGTTPQSRVVSVLRVVYNSFGLYILPYKLNVLFGAYKMGPINMLLLLSAAVLLGYLLYYFYKKDKRYFAILACIYISVLPLFSPISIGLGYAERYFYFGTIFFSILAVKLVLDLEKKKKKKNLALIIFFLIIPLFMFRTMIRTLDWRSDKTLWTAAQKATPDSYEVYNELGNVYYRENNLQEALVNYDKALKIRPQYPEVFHNAGLVYIKAGQLENAKRMFAQSLQLNPNLYESYYRLGQVAAYEGETQKAVIYLNECLRLRPDFVPAQTELAKIQ